MTAAPTASWYTPPAGQLQYTDQQTGRILKQTGSQRAYRAWESGNWDHTMNTRLVLGGFRGLG